MKSLGDQFSLHSVLFCVMLNKLGKAMVWIEDIAELPRGNLKP